MSGPPAAGRRAVAGVAAVAGTTAVASAVGSVAAAAYFARRVLTPDRQRPDDTTIVAARRDSLVLARDLDTVVPGRYGLWLDGGAGHARVGDIVADDPDIGTVERVLLGLDRGDLSPGPARWNQYYYGSAPELSLGLATRHIGIGGELGTMPAWVVAPDGGAGDRWAVLVHGRGARREETIRAIPPLRAVGWTVLVPSYRNDEGVPAGPDGRYNLGLSEWRDVEAAMWYAVGQGAREILLGGWSMGGAIVLQVLDRSVLSSLVSRVLLDAPVIDWADVLAFHARVNRLPPAVGLLSRTMMGRRWGKRLVGVHESVDVARTDWVSRSGELHHPVLLVHSAADDFVPVGPSRRLAERRPDLVRLEEWAMARHCTEWNVDPERWERVVGEFAS